MKRLLVLTLGYLILGFGGLILGLGDGTGAFGQKKMDKSPDAPSLKEIPGLIGKLKDKDAGTRAYAAKQLAAAGMIRSRDIKEAIPTFMDMIKSDPDARARTEAATALGFSSPDPKMALPILLAGLKDDKDFNVKTACATSLGYFGPEGKEAVPALQEAVAIGKTAAKDEKDKRNLAKAAGTALQMINGGKR
jgi:HEAT repeat protein